MKKQPIKIVRGNDIVLRATCYVRNEIGELEAIDLQGCDVSVSASMLQGGMIDIPYSIVDSNTLELDCKAEVFPVLGSYSIDIRIVKDGQNVRFATRAAVQIVEYSNELYEAGECRDGEYSVVNIPDQIACTGPVKYALHVGVKNGDSNFGEVVDALTERVTDIEEKNAEQDEDIAGFGKLIEDLGEQITPMLNQLNSALGDVISEVGKQGEEIDTLLDKAKDDYEVKQYTDYTGYYADTSRPSNTISFIEQDNSIWMQDRQYSMNAGCFVGSDASGISTTGNWFLCGEATFTSYTDVNIIGTAVNTLVEGMGGLFVLNLRSDQQSINPNYTFQWLCKVGPDAKTPVLRYVINGMTIKLYCKVFGGQYSRIHVRLFNQVNRAGNVVHKEAFFKLKDSTTIIPEADVPNGTDIADAPYITTSDANNKFLPILATTSLVRYNPNVGYIKFAEIDTKGQFGNKAIILSVSTTFASGSNWNDGLYMLNIRGNGTSVATCRAYCFVQYREGAAKIQLYFAFSGSKIEFYREVRAAKESSQLGFKILSVENFEEAKNWDFKLIESSKITSDATLDTPIGTLNEIPNRGQAYITDNALKIQQVSATANATRRLLLGEAHDTTQYDAVYKATDLTYNPDTKTLTVPQVNGNAATATKLKTAFTIRWGSANITQWQRIIRFKTKTLYAGGSVILSVADIESGWVLGTLGIYITTEEMLTKTTCVIEWLSLSGKNNGIHLLNNFKAYKVEPTDSDEYVYIDIYANSPAAYTKLLFTILNINDSEDKYEFGGTGVWIEESAITGTLAATSTYKVFDELDAIKARLAALEAKTTTES